MSPSPAASPPFACRFSPEFPRLLAELGATLVLSTYQAGKLVFFSPNGAGGLAQLPRSMDRAMGVAEDAERDLLAVACRDQVHVFRNSRGLAGAYPKAPGKYDALYMPRSTHYTGPLDVHDLHFGADGGLYAVNTLFSCVMRVDGLHSFEPVWVPPFVDRVAPEDRCHLNGMAMEEGRPRYATAFNAGNTPGSWRAGGLASSGVVMDIEANRVVAEGLGMPHSPALIGGELYVLESAKGALSRVDRQTGEVEVVARFGGFVRGLAQAGDYLFIGLSKVRESSKTFGEIASGFERNVAGVVAFHLPTRSRVGILEYVNSVEEIYDVHILQAKSRPNLLTPSDDLQSQGVSTPETTFWRKPEPDA